MNPEEECEICAYEGGLVARTSCHCTDERHEICVDCLMQAGGMGLVSRTEMWEFLWKNCPRTEEIRVALKVSA